MELECKVLGKKNIIRTKWSKGGGLEEWSKEVDQCLKLLTYFTRSMMIEFTPLSRAVLFVIRIESRGE